MPLLALGLNHRTAPVDVRERVAFDSNRLDTALRDLLDHGGAREAAILSTCNRTELYCGLKGEDGQQVVEWLGDYHLIRTADLQPYLYQHVDQRAVRHILRVASGLDSMVLGEPQILGQVKAAYHAANSAGALGSRLERLFQHTFAVAKQVRTDTRIGASPVSVAFAAVSLAKQIFADLPKRTALLIGAGDTVELVTRHLHENGIGRLVVANRTLERAHALVTPFDGFAIALEEIPAHLAEADIVISATASPGLMLEAAMMRQCLKQRRHRPMFMVDLAVPRDIDPAAADLEDVYLYTVDDLKSIIQDNLRSRQTAAAQAEEIIDNQVEHFMAWLRAQDSAASIRALRQQAEAVRDETVARAQRQLAQGRDPLEVLNAMANTLTNKLIHTPCAGLREAAAQGDVDMLNLIKSLYRLNGGNSCS
ncbi:MAG TPA: glutamyl-tRNA reductase [Candidatus Competibacteraceae bacterium]|nr:MAG: glutamyl-tRNA reductase [Candidatus Competibacteraceae bacterium]HOB63125.1 glutamyl-tRNA reductase [Candidatus Competibacteraceae bacterium]HQA26354.1 glutamyl-tRNA reductase [Candidatus Competibacteraceae bacterium]HQD57397.1 glutamyl-tRNA reductase [Candidatus Competibacteraceae bacterium]